jgi:hypothetical protein
VVCAAIVARFTYLKGPERREAVCHGNALTCLLKQIDDEQVSGVSSSGPPATESAPAQFVEVNAEIEGIQSNSITGKIRSRRVYHVKCIVGTNSWIMEGDFPVNARDTYWFTGTNIVMHSVTTPLPLEMQLSQIVDKVLGRTPPLPAFIREPKAGEQWTTVLPSTDPNQITGFDKVPWLAFCSGPFLQSNGSQVPTLIWLEPVIRTPKNFSNTTSLFPDALGLPKQMESRTPDHHLFYQYTVEEATNFLGWTFPMRFKLAQYQPRGKGVWEDDLHAEGKVISIRKGAAPAVPDDVLKAIKK